VAQGLFFRVGACERAGEQLAPETGHRTLPSRLLTLGH
jgi:hypothetical protein